MNEKLQSNVIKSYQLAEQKAAHYFQSLYSQVTQEKYVQTLTKDIQSWKDHHIPRHPILSSIFRKNRKPDSKRLFHYIQWLDHNGKLDNYLDRSISYIFLRDLGKTLDSSDTQIKVRSVVTMLKNHLTDSIPIDNGDSTEMINISRLYRWAQSEGLESTIIWLINKLNTVSIHIPQEMDAEQAQRKLIKIIAGVMLHVVNEMSDDQSHDERTQKLDQAIRLGYSYGLTYPFIDDLLDAKILSVKEKEQFSKMIRTTLITGTVPEMGNWTGKNLELIRYIYSELRDAFEYIKDHQRPETRKYFFEQSYVFFHSQEVDREKVLFNSSYTNEEIFIPVILKSSSSRLIVRSVISAPLDEGINNRTFYYGIYNQLADDFTDMFEDMNNGAVTPYTYFLTYHDKRPDLINPFELYWTVISNLIHNVYQSDTKTCEVILDRAINSLKRFKERAGSKKYNEVMELFATGNPKFNRILQNMISKADDVDFFDKLIRDQLITSLKKERMEREDFLNTINTVRNEINSILFIPKNENDFPFKDPINDAANYILEGEGKRLRPIITWVMGVSEYGLKRPAIVPLLRSLEYMHTASLIFDDLPSQDNASFRRGRLSLHKVYNIAIAELTGLFLTQKAIEEQASLDQFDSKTVLQLIRYSAKVTEVMCKGQVMDLDSTGKQLTLEQLNLICYFKTGIAFEASLIMPAILAHTKELEIEALKKFAYHAGIAYQIKDDLLDVEGDQNLLGKPVGKDAENNHSTFVTILGSEGANKEMWEHFCLATEVLKEVPRNTTFLKHLLNYFVIRGH